MTISRWSQEINQDIIFAISEWADKSNTTVIISLSTASAAIVFAISLLYQYNNCEDGVFNSKLFFQLTRHSFYDAYIQQIGNAD